MEIFPETTPITSAAQSRSCPRCDAAPLARVADCELVHWLCRSCGHCWQESGSRLRGVNPLSCPGCATKPRDECLTLFGEEFPRFSV
jgi:hypothetical protein